METVDAQIALWIDGKVVRDDVGLFAGIETEAAHVLEMVHEIQQRAAEQAVRLQELVAQQQADFTQLLTREQATVAERTQALVGLIDAFEARLKSYLSPPPRVMIDPAELTVIQQRVERSTEQIRDIVPKPQEG